MSVDRVMCDDGMRSGCNRLARLWVTVAAGEIPVCDLHAEWYLRQGRSIYPIRSVSASTLPPNVTVGRTQP